jgi:hypothetical protein
MVEALRIWYAERAAQPYVRPWGLATPILVLVFCLPLLRPLRNPTVVTDNEKARLATVQAIVEHHTLEVSQTSFRDSRDLIYRTGVPPQGQKHDLYSKQPPVMAALLAGPYTVLDRMGINFDSNASLTMYLLTLLGSTLPVAGAAGLIYRMGRLFELRRPWRMALAIAGVFGTGLVSYATVLNPHAPAAALILATCSALIYASLSKSRGNAYAWLAAAGLCASFAAAIDPGTAAFLILLPLVIVALRWPVKARCFGLGWYILGAIPALALHAALTVPVTGDLRPGYLHPELAVVRSSQSPTGPAQPTPPASVAEEDAPARTSVVGRSALHFVDGVLGPHGLLSHFPILLIGLAGIGMIIHRHWPSSTKMMALVSALAAASIVGCYICLPADWGQPMFATRWFVPFVPLLVFWGGAWLRHRHHSAVWAGVALLLGFSVLTTLLGATDPFTKGGTRLHTAYVAAQQLLQNQPPLASGQTVAASPYHD